MAPENSIPDNTQGRSLCLPHSIEGILVKSKFVCKFLWVLVNRVYGSMLQEEELSKDTKPPREFPLQPLVIRASSGCKYIPLLSGHLLKKI